MNALRSSACAAAVATLMLAGFANIASGQVLVRDTWKDGTDIDPASPVHSENGVDIDGDGDLESAWYQGGDGTLDPVGANGPLRGRFSLPTSTSSASWTTYFTPGGSEANLANNGDKLRVTWKYTLTNVNNGGSNTSQNFRFALVNTANDANRLAANGAPVNDTYQGYAVFANMSGTLGNSNPFQLRERTAGSNPLLNNSGDWGALANGATSGATGYVAGQEYTMIFELTRNGAGLDVAVSMSGGQLDNDGVASVNFFDPNGNGFTFDTFSVRPSGATTTAEIFDTSLFQVEVIQVPEPTSLAILGLAGLGLVRRRRYA